MKKLYGLFGAGGFAREVMPLLRAATADSDAEVVFVVEGLTEPSTLNGHAVLSAEEFFRREVGEKYFNIAIADYQARERIAETAMGAGAKPFTIAASNVVVLDGNDLGAGAILCPFVTVTSNARIGKFFHANIYSYVAHDCVIGDYVTFAPNVHCNGTVVIEDYAYLGTGAVLRQGTSTRPLVIGKGAVVGMGAVVTKSVEPYATVVGNPASPLAKGVR